METRAYLLAHANMSFMQSYLTKPIHTFTSIVTLDTYLLSYYSSSAYCGSEIIVKFLSENKMQQFGNFQAEHY